MICLGSVPAFCRPVNHTDDEIMCVLQWLTCGMLRAIDNEDQMRLVGSGSRRVERKKKERKKESEKEEVGEEGERKGKGQKEEKRQDF